MATSSANEKKIFVGNLDFGATESDLKVFFECAVGPVEGINIRRDRITKQHRGFAFVTFASAADAKRALDTMQNVVHKGRTLTIKPQIARGGKSSGAAGRGKGKGRKKKPSLWGDKSSDGWFTPSADGEPDASTNGKAAAAGAAPAADASAKVSITLAPEEESP